MPTGSVLRELERLIQQDKYWCDITEIIKLLTRELYQTIRDFLVSILIFVKNLFSSKDLTRCLFWRCRPVQLPCSHLPDLLFPEEHSMLEWLHLKYHRFFA